MILARARTGTIYDFLSPPLILVTPFISFMKYNDYSYIAPEFWICVAGLLAIGLLCGAITVLGGTWLRVLGTAGLLTLFVDLQFDWFDTSPRLWVPAFGIGMLLLCWLAREHLSRIVAPVFAIMLASTVALYALGDPAPMARASTRASVESAPANGLPTIVHIMLDEHIGIEGIPADVQHGRETKAQLKSFFQSHGFRLFGHAYSRYASTRNSLPNTLNYTSRPLWHAWADGDRNVVLQSNRYFADMSRAGYEIHAFQIGLVDLCRPSAPILASCYTEDHTGLRSLETSQFSLDEKTVLIYKLYARLSKINDAFQNFNTRVRGLAEQNGWEWPRWWSEVAGMPPVGAVHTLSLLADAVARSAPGQMFFAHLLLPHNPYIYDGNCNERHPADWDLAHDSEPLPANTMQSRAHRYALYLEQVQCLYKKLGETFERWQEAGVFDHAIIIMHGDHGSRIYLHRPEAPNLEEILVSDYADAYSTLLAVKAPGYEPGYDLRWIAIQDLLPQLVTQGQPRQMAQGEPARLLSGLEPLPYVFLNRDGPRLELVKQPLPTFGDASRVANHFGLQ
jgi:hypothetical protein